jgi:hypothetical protein
MSNSLSTKHPEYTSFNMDWTLMRDAYKGERQVKSKTIAYLPHTASQIQDGAGTTANSVGSKAYSSYIQRTRFSNYVREAVQTAIGMMHSQPPKIEVPEAMSDIRSSKGETMEDLLRRINTEQLLTGRIGLMADIPTKPDPDNDMPYLTTYPTERLINWDDGKIEELVPQVLNLVVLDESEYERKEGFSWEKESKYRVLIMGKMNENQVEGIYSQGVFENETFSEAGLSAPSWKGTTLNHIPFVIINSCDLQSEVDEPPLLDLGNMTMTIYRGDADYRQNLYMQGQDTLVTSGGAFDEEDTVRVGAGARIDLPMGGKAEYIGVTSTGLSEQREALGHLHALAGSMGAQTLDSTSRERESGDSLRIRIAARTADMNQIVETGAAGLESILKSIAMWVGEDPNKVSVTANKEFGESPLTGQTMVEMATARTLGFPLSARSMHNLAKKRRMTEMTFEEELATAKKEEAEDFPFAKPDTADRAAAEQNGSGKDTDKDISARNKAKKAAEDG